VSFRGQLFKSSINFALFLGITIMKGGGEEAEKRAKDRVESEIVFCFQNS